MILSSRLYRRMLLFGWIVAFLLNHLKFIYRSQTDLRSLSYNILLNKTLLEFWRRQWGVSRSNPFYSQFRNWRLLNYWCCWRCILTAVFFASFLFGSLFWEGSDIAIKAGIKDRSNYFSKSLDHVDILRLI